MVTHKIVYKADFIKNMEMLHLIMSCTPNVQDATNVVSELYHFCYWIALNYARTSRSAVEARFDPGPLEKSGHNYRYQRCLIQALEKQYSELRADIEAKEIALQNTEAGKGPWSEVAN